MELQGRICVVTGAASGIGAALCRALAKAGAAHVVCADLNFAGAEATAKTVDGSAAPLDVADPEAIETLVARIEAELGPIDLFCSNAGLMHIGGLDVPDATWTRLWDVNVMAHIRAARAMIPRMAARGGGYLLNTASAAGLLNQIGSAPYGVTKHAAVGFAEWVAMSHADDGIKVSVLCPQAVRTEMTRGLEDHVASIDGMLEPDAVAETCIKAIRDETFLILPHPEVHDYMRLKAEDYERWIGGMTKLNRRFRDVTPTGSD